ncbi:hypothetical protein K0T92_10945 [Paenibacillus oenotherae]|uniref:Uncharacterized protein n=1 Tax=Paenibacillus oenotherae TaxID=1435645 RepID=A0ABS7D5P8_9BACL|nr:hypothetical protein [Paenibacillus oenotherae]MBW7475264.1 hypothetical protein [Paenibacillus oenotherae]
MIVVKVKSKGHAVTIPIPYVVLRMGSGILTSHFVQRKIKDWLNKHGGHTNRVRDFESDSSRFGIEPVLLILDNCGTKQALRQLVKELQYCKGTVLVDVQTQDGTEVLIKL